MQGAGCRVIRGFRVQGAGCSEGAGQKEQGAGCGGTQLSQRYSGLLNICRPNVDLPGMRYHSSTFAVHIRQLLHYTFINFCQRLRCTSFNFWRATISQPDSDRAVYQPQALPSVSNVLFWKRGSSGLGEWDGVRLILLLLHCPLKNGSSTDYAPSALDR